MATPTRTITAYTSFSGRRKDGGLVASVIPQFDGSEFAAFNCAGSGESVRDIVEIANRAHAPIHWPPNPAFIRMETGDRVGGMRPTQTAAVSRRVYGIDSDIRIADTSVLLRKLWARYAATLLVRYEAYADAGLGGSPGFRGNHTYDALGIRTLSDGDTEILISDSLRDGRRFGIPEGLVWVNLKIIQQTLSSLDLGGGTTMVEKYGGHHGYFSFTITPFAPPLPPVGHVVLKFGAHKVKPKLLRAVFERTILHSSPRAVPDNHVRVVPKGDPFNAYQRVDVNGRGWIGNKAGTLWVLRSGYRFQRYIK